LQRQAEDTEVTNGAEDENAIPAGLPRVPAGVGEDDIEMLDDTDAVQHATAQTANNSPLKQQRLDADGRCATDPAEAVSRASSTLSEAPASPPPSSMLPPRKGKEPLYELLNSTNVRKQRDSDAMDVDEKHDTAVGAADLVSQSKDTNTQASTTLSEDQRMRQALADMLAPSPQATQEETQPVDDGIELSPSVQEQDLSQKILMLALSQTKL